MAADALTAVVTGAASGIGRALAEALHAKGAHLILADLATDALSETATRLGARGITADVSDPAAMHALAAQAPQARLICLNAGVVGPSLGAPWEVPPDEWNRVFDVNVGGVVNGLRAFVPGLLASGEPAHVLITASLAGLTVFPGGGAYGPSKHAVTAIAQHAAMALVGTPVRVSMICPALVSTGMSSEGVEPAVVAEAALRGIDDGVFAVIPSEWQAAVVAQVEQIAAGNSPMPVWLYPRCPLPGHHGRVRSRTEGSMMSGSSFDTLAVHGGERRPGPEGSVVFPIYQGTVFEVAPGTSYHDIRYIRLNTTPSQAYLHDKLAALEHAEAALATSSGMAAVTTVLHSVLRAGDHLLAGDCLYGGTHEFLTQHAEQLGWTYTLVDPGAPHTWEQARTPQTTAFLVETITNPLMRVGRLREVAEFGRRHVITTIIDNTFASPVNFQPLAAGFDLCFHSATKYLNGHSDIVAGAVAGNAEMIDRVRHCLDLYGGSLDPHAGFLLARGLKTLSLRMRAHNANAAAVAEFLRAHDNVTQVNYPGLPTHPDHAHAATLLTGFGGMLSFRLAGGADAAAGLLDAVRLPYIAPSLGGVETLITRPATTSHAGMTPEDRDRIGITDDLIRMSCGIEAVEDLIEDLDQALAKV